MQDLVSNITPCCNSAEFTGETTQSVLNPTYQNREQLITKGFHVPTIKPHYSTANRTINGFLKHSKIFN